MILNIILLLLKSLFYLTPGVTEIFIFFNEANAIMINNRIYLDIKYARNFLYLIAVGSIIFSLTKFRLLLYFFNILFVYSNYLYLKTIIKWYEYI